MMTCEDHVLLEHVDCNKCDELAWCGQAGTRDTESTGCVVGQTRQLVDQCACECYGRRGIMYQRQTCREDSMRGGHTNRICVINGVESRVLSVIGCGATVYG